jgi:hypothetical protein
MSSGTFLKKTEKFEIEHYKKPRDVKELAKTHVCFSGSPQKHAYDSEKVLLVIDPYSASFSYYEFDKSDIRYVEELPNIVTPDGEIMAMVRIWVKKMSIGLRCIPFMVDDIHSSGP